MTASARPLYCDANCEIFYVRSNSTDRRWRQTSGKERHRADYVAAEARGARRGRASPDASGSRGATATGRHHSGHTGATQETNCAAEENHGQSSWRDQTGDAGGAAAHRAPAGDAAGAHDNAGRGSRTAAHDGCCTAGATDRQAANSGHPGVPAAATSSSFRGTRATRAHRGRTERTDARGRGVELAGDRDGRRRRLPDLVSAEDVTASGFKPAPILRPRPSRSSTAG